MKNMTKRLICMALTCVCMLGICACAKDGGDTATGGSTDAAADTIVGTWELPSSEWVSKSSPEYWIFTADGGYEYVQCDGQGNVLNKITGTYKAEGENLSVTMAGFTLEYTYTLTDPNTMLRSDHGTDATLKRYIGELK